MRPARSPQRRSLAATAATLTLVLASAASVSAADPAVRGTDPIGDATAGGPDIVAVETTITPDEEMLIAIELVEALASEDHLVIGIGEEIGCLGWFAVGAIFVRLSGAVFLDSSVGDHPIDPTFEGDLVSLTFPLSLMDPTDTVTLAVVSLVGEDPDERDAYPDQVDDLQVCHVAMSPHGGWAPDTALGSSPGRSGPLGWVPIGIIGLALVLSAWLFVERRGSQAHEPPTAS